MSYNYKITFIWTEDNKKMQSQMQALMNKMNFKDIYEYYEIPSEKRGRFYQGNMTFSSHIYTSEKLDQSVLECLIRDFSTFKIEEINTNDFSGYERVYVNQELSMVESWGPAPIREHYVENGIIYELTESWRDEPSGYYSELCFAADAWLTADYDMAVEIFNSNQEYDSWDDEDEYEDEDANSEPF